MYLEGITGQQHVKYACEVFQFFYQRRGVEQEPVFVFTF